jgi:flagellar protein FliS
LAARSPALYVNLKNNTGILECAAIVSDKVLRRKQVLNDQNPYQAYTDGSLFSGNPLNQVIALYQGALDATKQAEQALSARDIMGRGRAINKANAILTELLISLNDERGGEISKNLKRLYCYMQTQLSKAHAKQVAEPIIEVSALLTTLLEGWRGAANAQAATFETFPATSTTASRQSAVSEDYTSVPFYGGYMDDSAATSLSAAYSF